ncbi:hypothetical protein SAMN02927921_03450 [Sinomicrobium oceani]|uniref:Lipoprotein n=1 Tax=Sinomicrobium oceani TaxID=1150368 RepID=A0A1K1REE1_9FLAO|nr:hypothetical protein [Sinomicrobium oceani]SFW70313.1 hypothetical protein SAMN02927921_03450 [Sinomicrobium oceani]
MKRMLFLSSLLSIFSCQTQTLDITKIDLHKNAKETLEGLKISRIDTQNGAYKTGGNAELEDNGKISMYYIFKGPSDESKVAYSGIRPEPGTGGRIVEHDDKIAFINFAFQRDKTFELLAKLKKDLGTPDQILYDSIPNNESDSEVKMLLKAFSSEELKYSEDEFGDSYISFPLHHVWVKDGYIYKYTLLRGRKEYSNDLVIISKQALLDRIVFGYHNPDKDPIFIKYVQ